MQGLVEQQGYLLDALACSPQDSLKVPYRAAKEGRIVVAQRVASFTSRLQRHDFVLLFLGQSAVAAFGFISDSIEHPRRDRDQLFVDGRDFVAGTQLHRL